jgi:hypothetical protein
VSGYTIIRNIRGGWPNWLADLDDGRFLYVRMRHGEFSVGLGKTAAEAQEAAEVVNDHVSFAGVSDVVDALVGLRNRGFDYVCPTDEEKPENIAQLILACTELRKKRYNTPEWDPDVMHVLFQCAEALRRIS